MTAALSVFSGVLLLGSYGLYVRAILRGTTKPVKATWLILAILASITLAGMLAEGAANGYVIGAFLGVWATALLSLRYGLPGWKRVDKACLAAAGLSVFLWWRFADPSLAILASLAAICIGYVPTFASAWEDPSREDTLAWIVSWIASVLVFMAIPQWTVADAAQPVVALATESAVLGILLLRGSALSPRASAAGSARATIRL